MKIQAKGGTLMYFFFISLFIYVCSCEYYLLICYKIKLSVWSIFNYENGYVSLQVMQKKYGVLLGRFCIFWY